MDKIIELINNRLAELNIYDDILFELLQKLNEKVCLANKIENCLYDSDLYLVYMHTVPNGKVYIGITQNHPQTRWNEGSGYEKQTKFYKAIQKYGWINIKHEIIAAGLSKEEALKVENDLIIQFNAYDEKYGYNTRVNLDETNSVVQKNSTIVPEDNFMEISHKLINKYAIKTYANTIYYLLNGKYVEEKNYPIIEKELLSLYKVPLKKHKEIIKQIKILTHTEERIINNENSQKNIKPLSSDEIKKQDYLEISQELIKKYKIKTYGDTIYYLLDGKYVEEKKHPIIEKELLAVYKVQLRKHKEILRQIKILTHTEEFILGSNEMSFDEWIINCGITIDYLISVETTALYDNYYDWCIKNKETNILGKKTFYKTISENFNLVKKQKADGKRYFVY